MIDSMNYIISLYISIWSSFAYTYVDKIPKPKYTLEHKYKFVHYHKNQIETPYPETTMLHFHQALDKLIHERNQKVNVVHIGDSHIQADFISDRVRSHFNDEALLGNGGRGYFFPGSMASTHNAYNMKVSYTGVWSGCRNVQASKSCSWGLGGMTATTSNVNARFTINPSSKSNYDYPVTKVKVYYQVQNPKSYYVRLVTSEGLLEPTHLSADGYAEFQLSAPLKEVTFALTKQFDQQTTFTLEGVSLENDTPGVQYHSVGVNGATVHSFLRTPKLEAHLRSLKPDLVIVSLGTNDAYTHLFDANKYKMNLARLIQKIKSASPETSILLTTPGDCAYRGGWNKSNLKAVQKIKELSEETNCAVWDLFEVMGGLGSVNYWLRNGLSARDRVHLSGKGYRLQGDLLYDALIQNYADYCLKNQKLTYNK